MVVCCVQHTNDGGFPALLPIGSANLMFLQREDPLLPVLCQQMDSFLSKLASKFLPPSTIKANRDFSTLNYRIAGNFHWCKFLYK